MNRRTFFKVLLAAGFLGVGEAIFQSSGDAKIQSLETDPDMKEFVYRDGVIVLVDK